jgi:hypothetical protein
MDKVAYTSIVKEREEKPQPGLKMESSMLKVPNAIPST